MDKVTDYLAATWSQLLADSAVHSVLADRYFSQLIDAYQEPQRVYHTPTHLVHLLGLLQEARINDVAILWAAFYHDYVYVPGNSDNEAKSAIIAREQLSNLGAQENIILRIGDLIHATRTHSCAVGDEKAASFLDADMAILGVAPQDYALYAQSIRAEFSNILGFLFNAGRKAFVKKLLAKNQIFMTRWFYDRYEINARVNLQWELNAC